MTKIKICGLFRQCDIAAVNRAKPDFIGFVFAAKSHRRVSVADAAALKKNLSPDIASVGVFVNEKTERVLEVVKLGIIDVVQLHGFEDEAYIKRLKDKTDKKIIKAVAVQGEGDVENAQNSAADYLMFDRAGGGTGKRFDWSLITKIKKPFFLAGGLNADNVQEAIAALSPYAVDISGGVETDGLKDAAKVFSIVRRVKND